MSDSIRQDLKTITKTIGALFKSNEVINQKSYVFIYWSGKKYKLVELCLRLIEMHVSQSERYLLVKLNNDNISQYLNIPQYLHELHPAHKADYLRVALINKYGGIWFDADTLLLDTPDEISRQVDDVGYYFVKNKYGVLCNAVIAGAKGHSLFSVWFEKMTTTLSVKGANIDWIEIGNQMQSKIVEDSKVELNIIDGEQTIYPVYWKDSINEFLHNDYDHYKKIERSNQCCLILTNTLYKEIEKSNKIFTLNSPINYFIQRSINNLKLKDYAFIEIGTSSFNTEAQKNDSNLLGLSVEPILDYLEQLPRDKTTKVNYAITANRSSDNVLVYYIPEKTIDSLGLPRWLKGCNAINAPHHMHAKHNVSQYVKTQSVALKNIEELLIEFKVHRVKFLKIDTEGHDLVILSGLFDWIKYLPASFYPQKIMFESNELYSPLEIDEIIEKGIEIGYTLASRGHDTVLIFS